MEERGLTCEAGVGNGQIGVMVCVSGMGGGNDNMLSGNGRERARWLRRGITH